MTLVELQDILGQKIKEVSNTKDLKGIQREILMDEVDATARIAKQMINNADVILRTNKLVAEGKFKSTTPIVRIVGDVVTFDEMGK